MTEEEIQKVVEGSGITLMKQVESDSYTVHGSWKSLQRARDILVKIYDISWNISSSYLKGLWNVKKNSQFKYFI